jgi:type I restriction enzyme S subunit
VTISARGTIGHSEVRYEDFYPAIRLIVATPDLDIVELDFFKYAVKNIKFTHSGSSIPQLTVPMLKNYFIIFPKSKKIQIEIIEKLNGLGKQVLTIKNSASNKQKELNLLKQSILQQAFSGELVKAA